jgi:hypothetical protein
MKHPFVHLIGFEGLIFFVGHCGNWGHIWNPPNCPGKMSGNICNSCSMILFQPVMYGLFAMGLPK